MAAFLETLLDNINDRIKAMLRRFFEAGQEYERGVGPDFDTYLAERLKGED